MKLPQRIAIYARVSSDHQAQHDTIASQLAAVQAFATAQGVRIDPDLIFADNGISGTTLARPKLDALRDKAAAAEIEQILILNPHRLARKYPQQLRLVEEFKKLGVTITFVNRQIATSPEDQLLLQLQGVIAEYEREKIVERHRRGKLHKAQQGKVCVLSGAPYGYVSISATDTEEARYEIHEREAAVVQRVFQLLVNEQQSIGAIARRRHCQLKEEVGEKKAPAYRGGFQKKESHMGQDFMVGLTGSFIAATIGALGSFFMQIWREAHSSASAPPG